MNRNWLFGTLVLASAGAAAFTMAQSRGFGRVSAGGCCDGSGCGDNCAKCIVDCEACCGEDCAACCGDACATRCEARKAGAVAPTSTDKPRTQARAAAPCKMDCGCAACKEDCAACCGDDCGACCGDGKCGKSSDAAKSGCCAKAAPSVPVKAAGGCCAAK